MPKQRYAGSVRFGQVPTQSGSVPSVRLRSASELGSGSYGSGPRCGRELEIRGDFQC